MKSYKEKFQTNLDQEITAFRERSLAQSPQEIYDDCNRIYFFEFMYDYLGFEEFSTSEYKAFLQSDDTLIENLWYKSLDFDDFNIGNTIDASCLVDTYIQDCTANPVPHCM